MLFKSELIPIARAKYANEIWYVIACDVLTPKMLPHCPVEQWGLQGISTTSGIEQLTLPLSATILIGIVCDGGNGKGDVGLDSGAGLIYGSQSMGVAFIVLCR